MSMPSSNQEQVAPMHAIDYAGLSTEPVKYSLMLAIKRSKQGSTRQRSAHVYMCKNCSQATGVSAAASIRHKGNFFPWIYTVYDGLLPAFIIGLQDLDVIGTGVLRDGLISQNP